MIRNGGRYASLILGAGALLWLAQHGIVPIPNPVRSDEYLIEDTQIDTVTFDTLISRKDVIFCLVWFFVTAGSKTTLPADFNTSSNQINAIGNGAGGGGGLVGQAGSITGSGGSCGGSSC